MQHKWYFPGEGERSFVFQTHILSYILRVNISAVGWFVTGGINIYMWDKENMIALNMHIFRSCRTLNHGLKASHEECNWYQTNCAWLVATRDVTAKPVHMHVDVCFWYWSVENKKSQREKRKWGNHISELHQVLGFPYLVETLLCSMVCLQSQSSFDTY